ncbi:hypothetical protein [Bacillus sp. SG-1]|uniref:hypothetical protein n=1 Tax=Bacillus sp. SG-1 TaxID=161544 RepID=UPI0001543908|nr:hypothetical protein [Bacillus sp. SG-1]EDL65835.1 hypothetical protein BSG1_16305 [Bacillus sp. SG-1]
MFNNKLEEALQQVEMAERNLLDAQGNNDPQHYQRAAQDIHYAQALLTSIHDSMMSAPEEEQKQYLHAKERMRILQEAHSSL